MKQKAGSHWFTIQGKDTLNMANCVESLLGQKTQLSTSSCK